MNYKIVQTNEFEKEAKYLSKKYSSFRDDLSKLATSLSENPSQGTSLGNNCYKIRMAITSKSKGKSAGARIITCVFVVDEEVLLVSVYDKSEQSTISDKEIKSRIKSYRK